MTMEVQDSIAQVIQNPQQGNQTVEFGRLDATGYRHTVGQAPVIQQALARIATNEAGHDAALSGEQVGSMAFDAYLHMIKNNPKPSGFGSPMAREIMDRVARSPDYSELRQYTIADELASALGSSGLIETTLAQLPDELRGKAVTCDQAQQELVDAQRYLDALNEDPDATPEDQGQAERDVAEKQQQAIQAERALDMAIKTNGKALGKAVAAGIASGKEQAEAVHAAGNAFGFGSQDVGQMDFADKLKLARTIQGSGGSFTKLMKLLGRMTREALAKQAAKTHHDAGAIVDIGLGSDLSLIMDHELLNLRRPAMRRLTQVKLVTDALDIYEVDQKETLARGDFVVLFDESGSMGIATESGYSREHEAKAVVLALAHVALKQRRGITVCFFQDNVTAEYTLRPEDYSSTDAEGNVAVNTLVRIATRGTAGGTSFDQPIMRAVELAGAGKSKADVLMLTDGYSHVDPATLKAVNELRATRGVSFYSMLFGGSGNMDTSQVAQFSNKVWAGSSILSGASDLFEMV